MREREITEKRWTEIDGELGNTVFDNGGEDRKKMKKKKL